MFVSIYDFAERVRPFGFENEDQYQTWWKTADPEIKKHLPCDFNQEYKSQWVEHQKKHNEPYTMSGFLLGTFSLSYNAKRNKLLPFEEQRKFVRDMVAEFESTHSRKFTTKDYQIWNKIHRPEFIYSKPERLSDFINWPDWWGHKDWTYGELKNKINNLSFKINNSKEYKVLVKNGTLKDFPLTPESTFRNNGWEGWPKFLGNEKRVRYDKFQYLSLEEHIIYAKSLNLPNEKAWRAHCKTDDFKRVSHLYTAHPQNHFENFPGYGDAFFGNGQVCKNRVGLEHYTYDEAVEKLKPFKFQDLNQYQNALKNNILDKTKFPLHPQPYYKNKGYVSLPHFLSYIPKQWQKKDLTNILNDIKHKHLENLDAFSMMVFMQYLNLPTQKIINIKGEDRKLGDVILGLTNSTNDITEQHIEVDDIVQAIENTVEEVFENEEYNEDYNDELLSHHIEEEDDNEVELSFLSSQSLRISEGLIEEVMADDYAVFSLINNALGKIWREFFIHQDLDIIRSKNNFGEFNSVVLNKFFEEYNLTLNHETPKHFNLSCGIVPNIMQIFTCCKLANQKRLFNFSGTGAGKTLSSIYSAIHNDNKFVVIITENNVTKQWENEIIKFDLKANILDKKLLIDCEKRNYLVINFEQFQLPRTLKLIDKLIELAPDFIILDEIQNVKVRGNVSSIRRSNLEYFTTTLSNNNPDLFLLAMSATPCVNNLNEIKSLLELGLNESLEKIKTSPTVMNAFYLHSYIVNYGIRYMPKYPILANYKYPDIDASDSYETIVEAHKEKNPLLKEQILLGFKLPFIMSFLKPGTLIYTEYVDGIAYEAKKYIEENSNFKVGLYTGNQSEEEKADNLAKFKQCHNKTKNRYDILIGSSTIGTGVDGLQEICDNLIYLTLPWTSASKQQVDGRVIRQNSKFEKVQIITPQVVYHAIVDEQEKTWSYDYYRQNIINNKKTLMDCVMDGVNPSHLDPSSKQQDLIKAHQGLNKWIEHLLENDMTTHSQVDLKVNNVFVPYEKSIKSKSDWAKLNTSWKKKHSSTLHRELNENKQVWDEYHSTYSEKRLDWTEIPAEVISKKLESRKDWEIADLGCGECLLRNNLPNHKITEFDHIAFDEKVISCDISKIPAENNSFDAAVLSLALMGTNWSDYIKESYRILKDFGLLIIAENEGSWGNFENNEIIDCLKECEFIITSKEISHGFIYIQALKG